MIDELHTGLAVSEAIITGLSGVRQRKNRQSRLKAAFSNLIEAASDFRPLDLDCRADAFLGFHVIGSALARVHEFSGIGDNICKIALKALFREQPSRAMECPHEHPIVLACLNGSASEGVAIAWLSKSKPSGRNVQSAAEGIECGEVWFGLARLVSADLRLTTSDRGG